MSELLKISLPDGSVREMPLGSTPADVAAAIGPGLAKAALAARVDGDLVDLTRPFTADAQREASRDGVPPIELVDGQKLLDLFVTYQLGLKPVASYELDPAFFDPFRETTT